MARSRASRCTRVARFFCWSSNCRTWARTAGGRGPSPTPRVRSSSPRSASSRRAATSRASAVASSTRAAASSTASPTPRMELGMARRRRRRSRAAASVARRRAIPTWDWAARAATTADAGSTPSRRTSRSATASTGGIRRVTPRHRERIVTTTSSGDGAHSSHTVCGGGSSMDFRSTLEVRSTIRSASSTMTTRHRPREAERAAVATSSRTSRMSMMTFSVLTEVTSGWEPDIASRQLLHVPHPGGDSSHCRAAAKARAATDRPEPGGPVNSHAWVMARGSATARRRTSTTWSCPTSSSQTLMATA